MNPVNKAEKLFYDSLKKDLMHEGSFITLGHFLYRGACEYAQRTVVIAGSITHTYKQLYNKTLTFTKKLQTAGIKPRDRVLLFFENSVEFYTGYYAIAQAGAVVVPLNTFLKSQELLHIIADAKPTALVASTALLEKLQADGLSLTIPLFTESDINQTYDPDAALEPPHAAVLTQEEMAVLLYTSGTTGVPKGVMLSSKNIVSNSIQGIVSLGFVSEERVLGVLPFFHSFAQNTCVWAPLLMGCAIIIVPRIERRYLLEGLTHKPTIFIGVPALFGLLCLMKNADLDSVRFFACGGDALPDKIRAGFELIYQRKIAVGYGLTETSPIVCVDLEDITEPTNSVGTPVLYESVVLGASPTSPVPPGDIGTIWVKGDNVMLGYYNEPQKTAEILNNAWLNTGDVGYFNRRGKLVITGREKDIVINKGFKIYPQEIENVLLLSPLVMQAAVIGRIDEGVGQIAVAYVHVKKIEAGTEKMLRELCEKNLASYKVPRLFICVDHTLPMTATGKVDKKLLRKKDSL